ncbi:MAG: regulatory protein RecX [Candidatus Omnitrophica bacterium]|nr:regulatory protein RecX [Candidatus Omnitrophota bacterium]
MDKSTIKGKKYSLRLLAARGRSVYELRSRLLKAGYDSTISENVISELKKENILNDTRFASEWVDSRLEFSPRAAEVIRSELEDKGVGDDIIGRVFEEKAEKLDNRAIARNLIKDKLSLERELSGEKLRAKVFRFLVGRGFDAEFSEELVEEI